MNWYSELLLKLILHLLVATLSSPIAFAAIWAKRRIEKWVIANYGTLSNALRILWSHLRGLTTSLFRKIWMLVKLVWTKLTAPSMKARFAKLRTKLSFWKSIQKWRAQRKAKKTPKKAHAQKAGRGQKFPWWQTRPGMAAIALAIGISIAAIAGLVLTPMRISIFVVVISALSILVIGVLGWLLHKGSLKTLEMPPLWVWSVLAALFGLAIFHWLFEAYFPEVWLSWYNMPAFWPMHAAIIFAAILLSVQIPAVRYVGFALLALTGIGLVSNSFGYIWEKTGTSVSASTVNVTVVPSHPPSYEVMLAIIAGCESSGKQFEEDDVTPLYNSKEGSSAVGKYQIIESLHGEKAKAMGYDLKTLEGNEAYARYLYSQEGVTPWESSRECWEPKLVALGYQVPASKALPGVNAAGTAILIVKKDESKTILVPPWHRWDLVDPPTEGWTTGKGTRDKLGRRVQVFETADGAEEIKLVVKIAPCDGQDCAWTKQ